MYRTGRLDRADIPQMANKLQEAGTKQLGSIGTASIVGSTAAAAGQTTGTSQNPMYVFTVSEVCTCKNV